MTWSVVDLKTIDHKTSYAFDNVFGVFGSSCLTASSSLISFHLSRFVDAAGYLELVADAIEKAEEEIYITDWW